MRAWLSVRVCWEGDNTAHSQCTGSGVLEAHGQEVKAHEFLVKGSRCPTGDGGGLLVTHTYPVKDSGLEWQGFLQRGRKLTTNLSVYVFPSVKWE